MNYSLENRFKKLKGNKLKLTFSNIFEEGLQYWTRILFLGVLAVLFQYLFLNVLNYCLSYFLGTQLLDYNFQNFIQDSLRNTPSPQNFLNSIQNYFFNPLIIKKTLLSFLASIILSPLYVGIIYCCHKVNQNKRPFFTDLIHGFQGKTFINLIVLYVIMHLFILISAFFFFLPLFYIYPVLFISAALIVVENASLGTAIKYSFKTGNLYFKNFFFTFIIGGFIAFIIGTLLFGFGIVFTIPFYYTLQYVLYKKTLGSVPLES